MQTKIGALCDRVLEAGWLVALITVPVFFNLYSSRIYEPDKLTFLRSVAVFMVAVWLIRLIEQEGREWRDLKSWFKDTPLVLPTLILALVYLLTTFTSVVPRVSWAGSYQRLQGTYTTFSYMIVFAIMLQTMRVRAQINRLVTTAILTSVPIAFYAILQHYGLDPLPWIGNVQARVAANMGNSIFLGAYLIMIAPLTWARAFDAFAALLLEEEGSTADVIRGAIYVFVAALQIIALFWTGSRGPQLGFAAGGLFFLLVLGFVRRWRWLVWGTVGLGVVSVALLLVLNIPGGPLESFKTNRYIGRLGRIFETEDGTGKVRVLIWEGALDLFLPHEPLEFPNGSQDSLNIIRPLIGYGPEAMWVAYNRFYPPDLAQVEARNASPDRSHNETFDALVITGLLGFVVYILLFASVFYYGFKWLGLIRSKSERNLFAGLWIVGGIVGAVAAGLARKEFIGVGLPLGMIAGVGVYLVIVTTFFRKEVEEPGERWYQLLLIALISAIIAHFVEIHFGIAIAVTRTYFWVYTALMVVVGYFMAGRSDPARTAEIVAAQAETHRSRRKRRRRPKPAVVPSGSGGTQAPAWLGPILVYGLLIGFLLIILVYNFVTNQSRDTILIDIIWHSLTTKLIKGQMVPTYGLISLFVLVWWLSGGLVLAEMAKSGFFKDQSRDAWGKAFLVYLPLPPLMAIAYAFVHANLLRQPILRQGQLSVIQLTNLVTSSLIVFYLVAFLLLFLLGLALYRLDNTTRNRPLWRGAVSWLHVPILLVMVVLVWQTNINVIRADSVFKLAPQYESGGYWQAAVEIYKHALDIAPGEDHYYLFLGRAYLELAKDSELEPAQRFAILEECRKALEQALALNPLNTDHSANLARLYSSWAGFSTNPDERTARVNQSIRYYEQATKLSPQNAQLLNEWGLLYMTYGHFEESLEKYQQSLALDQEFGMTYFGLGDLYYNTKQLELAAEMYEKGLAINSGVTQAQKFLGVIYAQLERYDDAIAATLKVLEKYPNDFDSLKNMTLIYRDKGEMALALAYAQKAAQARPDYAPIYQVMGELYRAVKDLPNAELAYRQALELNPQDVNSMWGIAMLYWDQGRLEEAADQLETAVQLSPDNTQMRQILGDLYSRTANWQKAAEAYEAALAVNPEQIQVRSSLAQAYTQLGRWEDAVAQTLQVLEASPDDFGSRKNLALLYQQLERIDEALIEAEKALELAPDSERESISDLIAKLRQAKGS